MAIESAIWKVGAKLERVVSKNSADAQRGVI